MRASEIEDGGWREIGREVSRYISSRITMAFANSRTNRNIDRIFITSHVHFLCDTRRVNEWAQNRCVHFETPHWYNRHSVLNV
jgi:hypothetical protein